MVCGVLVGTGYVLCSTIHSIRELYLFYSIASVGAGIVWSLPLSTVQRWFIERRGLALGLTVSGIGVGTFIWSPFVNYLIYHHGWRTAYTAMGILTMLVLFLAATVMAVPEEKGMVQPREPSDPDGGTGRPFPGKGHLREIIRNPDLWLISLFQFLFNVGLFFIFVHLVPFSIQIGIPRAAAAAALGLMGGLSVLGRIITPVVIERKMEARWDKGLIGCAACSALMLLWLTQVNVLWMLYVFVVLMGYFYGSWIPSVVALTGSRFELKHLGTVLGITQIGLLGGMVGPLVGGFVFDTRGSYFLAIVLCSVAYLAAGFVAAVLGRTGVRHGMPRDVRNVHCR